MNGLFTKPVYNINIDSLSRAGNEGIADKELEDI
jgi:hypothetical protein